jgi:hypothetical protein
MTDRVDERAGRGTSQRKVSIGEHLYQQKVEARSVHPVLIFGSRYSGKTVMLQSLLWYARQKAKNLEINFGRHKLPADSPDAELRDQLAFDFWDKQPEDFGAAKLSDPTTLDKQLPLFVPVNIKNTSPNARFRNENIPLVFMESMGEWYERPPGNEPYRDFHQEIESILRDYKAPLTIIFIVPTVAPNTEQSRVAQLAMDNALSQYQRLRLEQHGDNLLLLASKWDALEPPTKSSGVFERAPVADVVDVLMRWEFVWKKFINVSGVTGSARKALMPYSAAWLGDEGQFVRQNNQFEIVFDQFNKVLWNWLYASVTKTQAGAGYSYDALYPEVLVPELPSMSFYTRAIHRLLGVSRP